MVRVVHFSDWHGEAEMLPEADLYVCTGDMFPNFLKAKRLGKREGQSAHGFDHRVDMDYEREMQEQWGRGLDFRAYLGSPEAPLVCVRGNHDFVDAKHMFTKCNLVHEFVDNEIVEVLGLRVTGHRGIPWINGFWADETSRGDLMDRVRAMDHTCDLYLTHYPPAGIGLDLPGHWGLDGVVNWFAYNHPGKSLHCSGHVHEGAGLVKQVMGATYSNAATTYNVLERQEDGTWKDVSPL